MFCLFSVCFFWFLTRQFGIYYVFGSKNELLYVFCCFLFLLFCLVVSVTAVVTDGLLRSVNGEWRVLHDLSPQSTCQVVRPIC